MKKTALKVGLVILLLSIIILVIFKFSGKRKLEEEINIENKVTQEEDLETEKEEKEVVQPVQEKIETSAAMWQEGVSYTVGDLVGEGESVYKCLQSHTALIGWEPSKTPALWELTDQVLANANGLQEPSVTPDLDKTEEKTESSNPAVTKGALPKHILTGYWHNFDNGAECLKISDVPASYNLIAVAFADATSVPGAVEFNLDSTLSSKVGGYTESEFIKDIATASKKGQKVIISVGGELGAIQVSNDTEATNFANSVIKLIDHYGFDGVDIDLENGVNAVYMEKALRQVSDKVGDSLIIAMAPQTIDMQSTGTEYFKLAINIKDILTVVNTQFYNSGSMLGEDGQVYAQGTVEFMTALAAIQLENGLRPDQIGLGLPASPKGAGGGYVDPTLVNQALESLATGTKAGSYTPVKAYPSLRGAMNWSINWDASSGYKFAETVAPVLKSLSK